MCRMNEGHTKSSLRDCESPVEAQDHTRVMMVIFMVEVSSSLVHREVEKDRLDFGSERQVCWRDRVSSKLGGSARDPSIFGGPDIYNGVN